MKCVAIIGASGAIGTAFVRHYAAQDDTCSVLAISRSGMAFAHDKVASAKLDLEDADSIASAAGQFEPASLDIVILATGLLHTDGDLPVQPEKSLQHLDHDMLKKTFMVNSIGPALVMKHFLPLLKRGQRSVFAALSARVGSISDNRLGGWYGYRASKAALNMLVKTAAIEMKRRNKHAIAVGLHPGTVDSALSAPFQGRVPEDKLFSAVKAVSKMTAVLDALGPDDSGNCYAWDGQQVPA